MSNKDNQKLFWFLDGQNIVNVAYQGVKGRWFQMRIKPTKSEFVAQFKIKTYPLICRCLCFLGFRRDLTCLYDE